MSASSVKRSNFEDELPQGRISQLVRTIGRVDSKDTFETAVSGIKLQLTILENKIYVQKSFLKLFSCLGETFKGIASGISWKEEAVAQFADLLLALRSALHDGPGPGDGDKVLQWLVDQIFRKGSVSRISTLYVIHDVFIEVMNRLTTDEVNFVLPILYKAVDKVESAYSFKILAALFVHCLERISDWNNPCFPDFVDVVIGWMVDEEMKEDHSEFCAQLLLLLRPHFLQEQSFPKTLIKQVLEDMEAAAEGITSDPNSAVRRVLLLTKAYAAMLRTDCVGDKGFVSECTERMVGTSVKILNELISTDSTRVNMISLLCAVNECVSLSPGVDGPFCRTFLKSELESLRKDNGIKNWSREVFDKIWEGICVWIEGIVSVTQFSEDTLELSEMLMEFADEIDESRERILLIHSLFRTRNVSFLQKVYQWHLSKLQTHSVLFILAGISDIAVNKGGSILSMWALQPPIFELLIELATKESEPREEHAILSLLKCHCSTHSHFISRLTPSAEFSSDSPGARFVPTLMDFWIHQLQSQIQELKNELSKRELFMWICEWILEFLAASSPYAALLFQTNSKFFMQLFPLITSNSYFSKTKVTNEILMLLADDKNYSQVDGLQEMVADWCFEVLANPTTSTEVQLLCKQLISHLTTLLVTELVPNSSFQPQKAPNTSSTLTPTEFNEYLHRLLSSNIPITSEDEKLEITSKNRMSEQDVLAFVNHLILSKLRTPFGKPQELFGHIQTVLKKRSGYSMNRRVPGWKLHFMFLLEQAFQLWIHGSYVLDANLPEGTRSFYKTNKTPCIEWLKRIRVDLIEASFDSEDFYGAFYNAAIAQDQQKVRLALFHIQDLEGLKSMSDLASWYYLEGEFEKALEALNSEDDNDTSGVNLHLNNVILNRASAILSKIRPSRSTNDSCLDFLLPCSKPEQFIGFSSLLEIQLMSTNSPPPLPKRDLKIYSDDTEENNFNFNSDSLRLWTLIKVCQAVRDISEIPETEKFKLETQLVNKMLDQSNLNWTKKWLTDVGIQWQAVEDKKMEFFIPSASSVLSSNSIETLGLVHSVLETAARHSLLSHKVENAVWIYRRLLYTYFNTYCDDESGPMIAIDRRKISDVCKSKLIVKIGSQLKDFPSHLDTILRDIDTEIETEELSLTRTKGSLQSLFEKALTLSSANEDAWLALANFYYEFPRLEWEQASSENVNPQKQKALDAFANYLRLTSSTSPVSTEKNKTKSEVEVQVISRVIMLQNEGYQFECDPSEVIISSRWLDFLPQIAQTPSLRSHILHKFPEQSALFLLSHDSANVTGTSAPLRRKVLFDPVGFVLVDVNEETYNTSVNTFTTTCSSCCTDVKYKNLREVSNRSDCDSSHISRSALHIPEQTRILGKELLRVGTSPEELWSWNLQRVLVDWSRRVSSLKKDLARDPDPDKVFAYSKPVVTFLQELWTLTETTAESPAQVSFVARNSQTLPALIRNLSNCTSVEALLNSFEKLLFHAETFDSCISYKSPLAHLSPKFVDFASWGTGSYILGLPQSVTLVGVHPVVYALATKTKPKKIRFRGSNGKNYEYLVKGNENLNVDCGMMQFLSLSRHFLQQPSWTYAVTPLGKRGGLIQMVEGAMPIFLLYKKHLQRNNSGERTSEIFWRRMNALGCFDRNSSIDPKVLSEVFLSLQSDTPNDLISRELFLSAPDVRRWFTAVKGFTRDSGVSSAIGYLLGIGDRHLDNILVDLRQGRLVHVDFSLMFGKGQKLRVPECVPFRLTQNFSSALQYPGTRGPFSVYMEQSLRSFQKNEEIAIFCAKNIAFSSQIDEESPVDPKCLRVAEVNALLLLLKLRLRNIMNSVQSFKSSIVQAATELTTIRTSAQDGQMRLDSCEKSIDSLTVAFSLLKEAQADGTKLVELRSQCKQLSNSNPNSRQEHSNATESLLVLVYFMDNFGKKSLVTENDVQWANSSEKLIASQLQAAVQSKFEIAEEVARLSKSEKEGVSRLTKKLNRIRRLVANVDPLVSFVWKEVCEDGRLGPFKAFVDGQWTPTVAHFWLHHPTDIILSRREDLSQQCELVEIILTEMFLMLESLKFMDRLSDETEDSLRVEDLVIQDPNLDPVQNKSIELLSNNFLQKLRDFNCNTSVQDLIHEATSVENLSQMFEGWTPWA